MATKPKKPATTMLPADEATPLAAAPPIVEPALAEPMPFAALKTNVNYEELAELGRQNLSAVVKANEVLSEGLEAIGKELVGYAKTSMERASQATTALLGAKTLDEVVQLNTDLARTSLESLLQRSAKISEMGLSLATQTFAPFGGRVEAAFALATRTQAA
jgi:hypothetical protein